MSRHYGGCLKELLAGKTPLTCNPDSRTILFRLQERNANVKVESAEFREITNLKGGDYEQV